MKPPVWLVHRAQILAHRLLLVTYVPGPGIPSPGSLAWECAVQGMAAGMVQQAMRMLAIGSKAPASVPVLNLDSQAVEATRKTLLKAQEIALDGLVEAAEKAANKSDG